MLLQLTQCLTLALAITAVAADDLDFYKDFGNTGKAVGIVRFANKAKTVFVDEQKPGNGISTAKWLDVQDCVSNGKAAKTWMDYAQMKLRLWEAPGHSAVDNPTDWGVRRCQSFLVWKGQDNVTNYPEKDGVYSIQTYHRFERPGRDGRKVVLPSNIGLGIKDGGIEWQLLSYQKQPSQLWTFQCGLPGTGDIASKGLLAMFCWIRSFDKSKGDKCLMNHPNGDGIYMGDCVDKPENIWHIAFNKESLTDYSGNDIYE